MSYWTQRASTWVSLAILAGGLISAVILFWLGTALIKGFALVFGIGVLVSMFSAITISRTFLMALGLDASRSAGRFLMHSGLRK